MRLVLASLLLLSSATLLAACDGSVGCTAEARTGIDVTVSDRATGQALTTATVTARDGDYTEVLTNEFGDGEYMGAWERAGDYEVTVEAPGYQTVVLSHVVVGETSDGCHVVTESRSVPMGYAS